MKRFWLSFVSSLSLAVICEGADLFKNFQTRCSELAAEAEKNGTISVAGHDGWLFLASELRHIGAGEFWGEKSKEVSRARNPEQADPLPAILDFNEQLKARGIELLIVPIPPKALIHPENVPEGIPRKNQDDPPHFDSIEQNFYEQLRANGIQVVELLPFFIKNRKDEKGYIYCKQDSHWSGNGCVLAASRIADEIRNRPWFEELERLNLGSEWIKMKISGDLWRASKQEEDQEELFIRRIGEVSESGLKPVEPNEKSPIILLGDSHNLVFHSGGDMHARWAGLPDQLMLELGTPVDLIAVRGSGATPARINLLRRAQKDPKYWEKKKMVIWCFSAREFTQSDGWRNVPVAQ